MLNYRILTQEQYNDLVSRLIKMTEGLISNSTDIGDGKVTIGFGYTFNRNNNVAIWTRSGIALTNAEWDLLARIDAATVANKTTLGLQFTRTMTEVCSRRLNIDPPCRLKFDPGLVTDFYISNCG